jgi:hypothetical protein
VLVVQLAEQPRANDPSGRRSGRRGWVKYAGGSEFSENGGGAALCAVVPILTNVLPRPNPPASSPLATAAARLTEQPASRSATVPAELSANNLKTNTPAPLYQGQRGNAGSPRATKHQRGIAPMSRHRDDKGELAIADWLQRHDRELAAFFDAWGKLEHVGRVDSTGGAQCRRVLAEWISERFPADVTGYILFDADRTMSLVLNHICLEAA